MNWTFALLLLLSCMVGCSKDQPLTVNLVSGTYVVKYSHGTETLELRADGTYVQRYVASGKIESITNQGKWVLDAAAGEVDLFDIFKVDTGRDEPEIPPRRTRWLLKVVQRSGRIQMPIDPDRALLFEKQ